MIDFHTHILPGIDDGSASVEESVEMLRMLEKQGVSKVLLTPHFYAYYSSVDEFVENRKSATDELLKALEEQDICLDIYLGCEALYFDELWRIDNLKSLCIQGTDYIMVEMPFSSWSDSVIEGIERLVSKGLTPVVAHFERYLKYSGNTEKIYKLINAGALLQLNCNAFDKFFSRRKVSPFLKKGLIFVIGTDCHNLTSRKPDYLGAAEYIKKKLGERTYARFVSRQNSIIKGAQKIFTAKK